MQWILVGMEERWFGKEWERKLIPGYSVLRKQYFFSIKGKNKLITAAK